MRPRLVSPRRLARALTVIASLTAGLAGAGVVEVAFEHPERFADADHGIDAQGLRDALSSHLQSLGRRQLPERQTLRITVTDIDMAGERRPHFHGLYDVRVLTGRADWPRITLRYTLSEDGRVLASGTERLADMAYLQRSMPGIQQAYGHERRMLSRWFDQRLIQAAH
jgi:Protein of unknown function (DUF3016)